VLDKRHLRRISAGGDDLELHATISAAQGAPVRWIKMEPLLQSMSLVSIVKDAPHPNATRLFVEFMLSDRGQKVMADMTTCRRAHRFQRSAGDKAGAGHFKVMS